MSDTSNFPVKRALISVSDKTGLAGFAARLRDLGIEIVSTGGTATYLRDHSIPVVAVSEITQFPEILEGRVKTLHPAVHGAILANLEQTSHRDALAAHKIEPIGLVVINLYPFEETVAEDADAGTIIENIDVGGPAMIRAAAKNHGNVTVVTDPVDYDVVANALEAQGGMVGFDLRQQLAAKAFARTAAYDAAIASWFSVHRGEDFPKQITITGTLKQKLRYGENPHQAAGVYSFNDKKPSIVSADLIQGKELSYNNIADADAAFHLISEFHDGSAAVAIIKHANPCGVAVANTLVEAYKKALAADPVSAFGGIIALSKTLDEATAEAITAIFTEVIVAPSITEEARRIFAAKPNIRVLITGIPSELNATSRMFRSMAGGFLVQDVDLAQPSLETARVVTQHQPTPEQTADMLFAMRVAKHVKSNAIVFAKNGATLGIGAGQMSRVDSVRIAVAKARDVATSAHRDPALALEGSALASDAFFPFPDGLIAAAEAGAKCIIQPGGSVRDQDVIDTADAKDLAMILTGIRHFRH